MGSGSHGRTSASLPLFVCFTTQWLSSFNYPRRPGCLIALLLSNLCPACNMYEPGSLHSSTTTSRMSNFDSRDSLAREFHRCSPNGSRRQTRRQNRSH